MSASPNRILGLVVGAVLILLGVLGFFVTGGVGFFSQRGATLLGAVQVNPFHNVVHLLLGAVLVVAAVAGRPAARAANATIGSVCLALGIAGLFLVDSGVNVLAIDAADNVLHFGVSVVLLAVGFGAERPSTASPRRG